MDSQGAASAGHRARAELQQTEAAFAKVRETMVNAIITSNPEHVAFRERMVVGVQIIDAVKAALLNVVQNGQLAEHALAQENLLRR